MDNSFIMDAMVGSFVSNNFSGYVGCVLSMENAKQNLRVMELGG